MDKSRAINYNMTSFGNPVISKCFIYIDVCRFLETQQVLSEMDRLLNKIASDTFADLVLPGFIKFFGKI